MSSTDLEAVRGLAGLARLALTPEELARHAPELERILEAFQVLAGHATRAPAPPAHTEAGRPREDRPLPSLPTSELLAAAPASADGFFVVPKTVGGER